MRAPEQIKISGINFMPGLKRIMSGLCGVIHRIMAPPNTEKTVIRDIGMMHVMGSVIVLREIWERGAHKVEIEKRVE